jgi:hypothetical protein
MPSISPTFLEALIQELESSSSYNSNDQAPPACVLWTDSDAQWQSLFPALSGQLPIFQLGEYDPESRTGPAYWLRCVIAGMFPEIYVPKEGIPILYLPGVSRQEFRAVEDCPKALLPLAELQYRGVMWTQKNGKDWTLSAFLQSHDGGLEIEVNGDQATREAALRALPKLADIPVQELDVHAPLKAAYFDSLLTPDEERSVLQWLNDPTSFRKTLSAQEWQAFCSICVQKYKFHPERDGQLNAALLLGERENGWKVLWERYREIPASYPILPQLLRQVRPPQLDLFDKSECYPQDNEAAEEELCDGLMSLEGLTTDAVQVRISELNNVHSPRREWVWAKLGQAPLANFVGHLSFLSRLTAKKIVVGTNTLEFAQSYTQSGYEVDNIAMLALQIVQRDGSSQDIMAAKVAMNSIYKPWLEKTANAFQQVIRKTGYAATSMTKPNLGTCMLFIDAFRMDLAQRLADFVKDECKTEITPYLAALPPVTSTAKPALAPNHQAIDGSVSRDLNPQIRGRSTSLTAEGLRNLLGQDGFQILGQNDLGDPNGIGWTEIGQIDTYGHQHGIRLALHIHDEMSMIRKRVIELLKHGWKQVLVVTDHGWLLLPGGLPKAHLPEHLTAVRKGRCARLKESSTTDHQSLPWYWDANASIAFAPGISCYEAGKEYEHGGLSVQECVTPMMTIELQGQSNTLTFADVKWRGLRCVIEVDGSGGGMQADLRLRAGDADTSIIASVKSIVDGIASLIVENDDYIGENAFIVIIDAEGKICAQTTTVVGG